MGGIVEKHGLIDGGVWMELEEEDGGTYGWVDIRMDVTQRNAMQCTICRLFGFPCKLRNVILPATHCKLFLHEIAVSSN
jgi:hypothetical protein